MVRASFVTRGCFASAGSLLGRSTLKEHAPSDIREAEEKYFTSSEQEAALMKFGFKLGTTTSEEPMREINWQKGELLGQGAFGKVPSINNQILIADMNGIPPLVELLVKGNSI